MIKILELNNPKLISTTIYTTYFLKKYIKMYYKEIDINHILIKNINNSIYIYIVIHAFSPFYNLKKQVYLCKSLQYFLNVEVYIYFLNFNNLFLIKKLKLQKLKKLTTAFSLISRSIQKKSNDINLLIIFIFSIKTKNFTGLLNYFGLLLKSTKNHFFMINYINNFLKVFIEVTPVINSITIQIKGRLNGSARAKKYFITHTNKTQQYSPGVPTYNFLKIQTFYGICSIKLWTNLN